MLTGQQRLPVDSAVDEHLADDNGLHMVPRSSTS
jgi:hypothetical protein